MVLNAYIRNEEKSKINHLNFHLGILEEEEKIKCKVSRRKEIIKASLETNEIEMSKWNFKLKIH